MTSVLDLLIQKNHFLDKFSHLNEREILNFMEGNFDNLDSFYNSREKILGILSEIDIKIQEESIFEVESDVDNQLRKKILRALDYKSDQVTRILGQDLQILSLIETAKSNIIKELSQVKSTRKILGSYKSEKNIKSDKVNEKV
ncbi:MAG: hypothetical protein H6625_01620 [Bdellovibrionaceae bacterium]|nr:hypothetical protein [Pseudobdellovibrionaceae bacterium]